MSLQGNRQATKQFGLLLARGVPCKFGIGTNLSGFATNQAGHDEQ
jgi:hypothetical protein